MSSTRTQPRTALPPISNIIGGYPGYTEQHLPPICQTIPPTPQIIATHIPRWPEPPPAAPVLFYTEQIPEKIEPPTPVTMRKVKKAQAKRIRTQLRDDDDIHEDDESIVTEAEKKEYDSLVQDSQAARNLRNDLSVKLNSAAIYGPMNPGKWSGLLRTRR